MSKSPASSRPCGPDPEALTFPERRRYQRIALNLPGRFMRADKVDYPCRLKDISVGGATLTTTTRVTVGEHIIVYLMHLGGLEGPVVRRFKDGFAMAITATQHKREKLAAQIMRLSKQAYISEAEERKHPRTPSNDIAILVLADGTTIGCPVVDFSRSGASINTSARPALGTEVVLSNKRATVVRHHSEGIAVEFVNERLEQGGVSQASEDGDEYQI